MLKMGIGDLNEMQRNTYLLLLHREKRYATEGRVEQQAISATSGASMRAFGCASAPSPVARARPWLSLIRSHAYPQTSATAACSRAESRSIWKVRAVLARAGL
jgi:hypothetical protein